MIPPPQPPAPSQPPPHTHTHKKKNAENRQSLHVRWWGSASLNPCALTRQAQVPWALNSRARWAFGVWRIRSEATAELWIWFPDGFPGMVMCFLGGNNSIPICVSPICVVVVFFEGVGMSIFWCGPQEVMTFFLGGIHVWHFSLGGSHVSGTFLFLLDRP